MTEGLFVAAYGLLVILSIFLAFFWGRLALRRQREIRRNPWRPSTLWCDRYMVIAAALGINAVGMILLFGARLIDSLGRGLTVAFPFNGWLMVGALLGLYTMILSKFGFAWAIHLDKKNKGWIVLLVVCTSWVVAAMWLAL